jgi:hypothetical protein
LRETWVRRAVRGPGERCLGPSKVTRHSACASARRVRASCTCTPKDASPGATLIRTPTRRQTGRQYSREPRPRVSRCRTRGCARFACRLSCHACLAHRLLAAPTVLCCAGTPPSAYSPNLELLGLEQLHALLALRPRELAEVRKYLRGCGRVRPASPLLSQDPQPRERSANASFIHP